MAPAAPGPLAMTSGSYPMLRSQVSDVPAWWAALAAALPAASGLAGYWLAGRNEEARDRRAAEREERALQAARHAELDDERQAFQRDVLLELQDRLLAVTRVTTEVIMRDRQTLREQGQIFQLPEDLNKRAYDAGVDLLRIRERVLHDQLTDELEALHKLATDVELLSVKLRSADTAEAIRHLDAASLELTQRHMQVNKLLGHELRAILGREAVGS